MLGSAIMHRVERQFSSTCRNDLHNGERFYQIFPLFPFSNDLTLLKTLHFLQHSLFFRHPTDYRVQIEGCAAIENLCWDADHKAPAGEAGGGERGGLGSRV
jgi:hypothetical protein